MNLKANVRVAAAANPFPTIGALFEAYGRGYLACSSNWALICLWGIIGHSKTIADMIAYPGREGKHPQAGVQSCGDTSDIAVLLDLCSQRDLF